MMYGSPDHAKNEIESLVGTVSIEHCISALPTDIDYLKEVRCKHFDPA